MSHSIFKHKTPVQVRFVDVDKQGHVNNATILSYVETARVQFFHDVLGPTVNWNKTGVIIARTEINYFEPIFLEDKIFVTTTISKLGTKSFDMRNQVFKDGPGTPVLCSDCLSIFVCMDYENKQSINLPDDWRLKFEKVILVEASE